MKRHCQKYKRITLVFAVVIAGAWMASYVGFGPDRYPAAVRNQDFFEMFKLERAITSALNKEIVSSLKIAKTQKDFQIEIRNFLVKEGPIQQPLCGYFDQYTLTFEAEGIASNGERPTLVIKQPCMISDRTKLPIPIRIPVEDIFKLKPGDTDISFKVSEETLFSFKNIYNAWPEYWVLSKVEFSNSQTTGRKTVIERKELFDLSQKPITMDWALF